MKKMSIFSGIFLLFVSSSVSSAVESSCRQTAEESLEVNVGIWSSSPLVVVPDREKFSLTDFRGIAEYAKVLNNVSVFVDESVSENARAKFIFRGEDIKFSTPYLSMSDREFCFELSDYVTPAARLQITDVIVKFKKEDVAIRGISYKGNRPSLIDYTILDYYEMSFEPGEVSLDFGGDVYNENFIISEDPLFILIMSGISLACDDGSVHFLTEENLIEELEWIRLDIDGMCEVNSQIFFNEQFPIASLWLLGK